MRANRQFPADLVTEIRNGQFHFLYSVLSNLIKFYFS